MTMRRYSYSYYGLDLPDLLEMTSELAVNRSSSEKTIKEIEQFTEDLFASRETIQQIVNEFKSTGFYNWRGIKYFLYEYELHLKGKTKTYRDKIDPQIYWGNEDWRDFSTVEHIYPQRPKKPCWSTKFSMYSDKQRSTLRHSLGNLLPLSQPKNSSFQNKCFEDKKGTEESMIGFRYGYYSENEVANYEDWNAKEILLRGIKLVEFMQKRWNFSLGDKADIVRFLNLEFVVTKEHVDLKSM